VDRRAPVP